MPYRQGGYWYDDEGRMLVRALSGGAPLPVGSYEQGGHNFTADGKLVVYDESLDLVGSTSGGVLDARQYGVGTGGALTDYATQLQNFFNAMRDAGPGARGILPYSGQTTPFLTSAPVLFDSFIDAQGHGPGATILKLADGVNGGASVLKGRNFDALTGGGSNTAGEAKFSLRDMAIDGNKANNAGAGHAVSIFGYDYNLDNLAIRKAKGDGLYTEWGALGLPGPDGEMEANFTRLLIAQCDGNGWHYRGPHDSHFSLVKIQRNGGIGLWLESSAANTVAAGSNGVDVATFAGAGVLNVTTATVGNPSAGTLTLATSAGTARITYSGKTQNTFTGCTLVSGSGTLSTGGAVTPTFPYSGTGLTGSGMHIWGAHTVGLQADNGLIAVASGFFEGAQTGQVWLRAADCSIMGGKIFGGQTTPPGYGLKLGDTNYPATKNLIDTLIGGQDFQGLGSSTASVDFANSGSNLIRGRIGAAAGTAHITGTPAATDTVDLTATGQTNTINAANSLRQTTGGTKVDIGNGNFTVQTNGSDAMVFAKGQLRFPAAGVPTITSVPAAIGTSGNGAAVAISGNDRRVEVTITTASTGLGAFPATVANLTFAQAFAATPKITGIVAEDGPSAALLAYAKAFSTTQALFGFNAAPAPSTIYKFILTFEG